VSLASLRFRCTSSVEEMGNESDTNIENKTKNESIIPENGRTNINLNIENMNVDSNPHQPMYNEEKNNFRSNKTSPLDIEHSTTYSSTVNMCICIFVHMQVNLCVYVYLFIKVYIYICIYTFICMCTHIYIFIYF
jgi:hypothetical protein